MGLDIGKLKKLQDGITKKSGKGDGIYVYANKIGAEYDLRLLPPPPEMNGVYFSEQEVWWINGKIYLSNSTFGGDDVIQEEIDAALESKDAGLIALVEAKKNKMPLVKKQSRYLLPILGLACEYDKDNVLQSVDIIDEEAKVLISGPQLMREINAVVTSKHYCQNKTEDGIADMNKGYNMTIGKTGTGTDTEYSAMGWVEPMEMPEQYYKKLLNVDAITKKGAKSDDYLRSVIRNYLYGEAIIKDENATDEGSDDTKGAAKPVVKPGGGGGVKPGVVKPGTTKKEETPAAEKAEVKKVTPVGPKKPVIGKARSLADDLVSGNDDDDDSGGLGDLK